MAEVLERGRLRERALGPEEGHLEWLFLREAGGHDLAEQAQDLFGAQGPLVPFARHAQHLRLTLRAVEVDRVAIGMLGNADLAREARAVIEQLVDARIHGIDFTAQFYDVERWRARCGSGFVTGTGLRFSLRLRLRLRHWPSYITRAASTP